MSDKKISELPLASAVNPGDVSVLVSDGTDYQYTFTTLLQLIGANLAVGANISFGNTLPQNTVGKNGDVFINTVAGSFAQKISGTWAIVYTLPSSGSATDGTVLYGLGVPGSSTGNNNDTYINTGTGIFYKKSAGTWNQVFSMATGPQGPQGTAGTNGTNGTNGLSILNGSGNPSNLSTGINGDFYINITNYTLFGPKTAGDWGTGVSMFYSLPGAITIPFTSGGTNPFVINTWVSAFYPTYKNGKFLVQFKDGDGNLQDRPDIAIKRIIDRTGVPLQTGISMDFPDYPDGQIIVEYSNFDLL